MSRIQRSAELLAKTLQGKNQDYAGNSGEFFNFERAATFSGISVLDVINAQIGIKVTRIQNLRNSEASYESLADSYLDLAGYAIIAHAYLEA